MAKRNRKSQKRRKNLKKRGTRRIIRGGIRERFGNIVIVTKKSIVLETDSPKYPHISIIFGEDETEYTSNNEKQEKLVSKIKKHYKDKYGVVSHLLNKEEKYVFEIQDGVWQQLKPDFKLPDDQTVIKNPIIIKFHRKSEAEFVRLLNGMLKEGEKQPTKMLNSKRLIEDSDDIEDSDNSDETPLLSKQPPEKTMFGFW